MQSIDLSSLQELDFGPDWLQSSETGSSKKASDALRSEAERPSRDSRAKNKHRRDRRAGGAPSRRAEFREDRREGGGRHDRDKGSFQRRQRTDSLESFRPVVDVLFYPEDDPFRALCKAMRTSLRTFELFEIARLILEKPDRFVVVLKVTTDTSSPVQKLYRSVPDDLPFESEAEAVEHVLQHHLERFFKVETVDVEQPKGSFQVVSRCGVTGEILGPPNYHRYSQLLSDHHARNIKNLSFEQFVARLESVREPEAIESWLEKMTRQVLYTALEGEAKFDSLEGVRHYLLSQHKEAVVTEADEVRFAGRSMNLLPQGLIRKSVESEWARQKKFPLHTANNLRGRLRRMKFNIHKRGLKGISYVCGVKRKFSDETTVFSDSIGSLLDFIDQHPNLPLRELPQRYLGVSVKDDMERTSSAQPADISEPKAAVLEHEKTGNAPESDEAVRAAEVGVAHPPQALESKSDEARLRHLMLELHWLVSEGYVTEFSDGRLFANRNAPPSKGHKKQTITPSKAKEESSEQADQGETAESE